MLATFREIFTYLTAAHAQPKAVSVLPPPPAKQQKEKVKKVNPILSQIDEQVTYNERGAAVSGTIAWDSEAAVRQKSGAVDYLTAYDIAALKLGELWPTNPKNERGKVSIERNKQAKKMWYNGATKQETAAALGVSDSWVEKRGWVFGSALSQEIAENSE